ncbi:unnamed protein product [Paramecium sonneborni]|uniref:Uncharacterized protein n=1 Tax=Paramecium sonneborni TaxID=65129 RepID=A0A8S1P2Z2_9CILI|nr:unnamed protein product [Paramecium sonneborni]
MIFYNYKSLSKLVSLKNQRRDRFCNEENRSNILFQQIYQIVLHKLIGKDSNFLQVALRVLIIQSKSNLQIFLQLFEYLKQFDQYIFDFIYSQRINNIEKKNNQIIIRRSQMWQIKKKNLFLKNSKFQIYKINSQKSLKLVAAHV